MSYPLIPRPFAEGPAAQPRYGLAALGLLAAGLLALPGKARADGYGHAEITLGFPHGAVTVGRTWEDHPRQVVVEEVTHKYPEADDEASYDETRPDDEAYGEESDDPDIVIEKRIVRPHPRQVTIIERYEEPAACDRVHVVRKVYVERPSCDRQVVVYGRPAVRVYHASGPTVIVNPGRTVYHGGGWHGDEHGGNRGGYSGSHNVGNQGPRNLFPEDQGRPMRARGVGQHMVQIGAHR